ncbi:NADH-quinone oxidoreductase subunit L [bacterium HR17]|uniref:NADH-quinone oxidoreductase subunit L n=1 Tax=Candidatus Fervidibacter japonicus TaxID=2035412 RepID=A0A2H5XGC7_9BACT|nr:NADH-quinone oxidoreductase subunit L [bacterium HR17]
MEATPIVTAVVMLAPFGAYLVNVFFGRWLKERAHLVSLTLVGVSAMLSLALFGKTLWRSLSDPHFHGWHGTWFTVPAGAYTLKLGYQVDQLTAFMLVVVTFIGWFIQLYSVGYMHGDPRYSRYFAFLSLFKASMLLLVLTDNLVGLYAAWELVGLCSYLLIGFWFEKPEAARAAKKAFIVTRIGDAGFALGIFLTFAVTGVLGFSDIFEFAEKASPEAKQLLTVAAILLFCGAVGKSAQFPLHIWLPDAMEGPTPVSALIHAATMVAAGVYMVGRLYPLFALQGFEHNPALTVVAWTGGFTAFLAATIAVAQDDIKRVLAYSTISQLGYMLMGLGVGGFTAGLFHLVTHAFFKALLFLGSGSVIHAVGHNDMKRMGGLKDYMPITFWTYLCGTAALAGVPPFAGFWSKDEILGAAFHSHIPGAKALFALGLVTAFLTAFYMTRQIGLVFWGKLRDHHAHPHESPPVMTIPLAVLAFFSVTAGFIGIPGANLFERLVHFEAAPHHTLSWLPMILSIVAAALGIGAGYSLYIANPIRSPEEEPLRHRLGTLYDLLANKWYLDWYDPQLPQPGYYVARGFIWLAILWRWFDLHIIDGIVNAVGYATAFIFATAYRWFDLYIVDGAVNFIGWFTKGVGNITRRVQTGLVQHYMFLVVAGLAAVALWALWLQLR